MSTFGPSDIASNAENGFEQGGVWTAAIAYVGNDSTSVHIGLRWNNVTIAPSATINSATIKLTPRNLTGTITNVHGTIAGHKGDAPAFADGVFSPNVGFTPTTATVAFDPTVWTIDAADEYVATVTTIVQEIVNGTWSSGSDMAFRINDNSSTSNNSARIYTFNDGDATRMAHLTIDYTEGAVTLQKSFRLSNNIRPNAFAPGFGR